MRVVFIVLLTIGIIINSYGKVVINEFLSSNYEGIVDEDGEYSDWFEIYNNSGVAVDLSNYSVTDDKIIKDKWIFPSMSIQPYNYLLIFASGKNRRDISGGKGLHTNFKLDNKGEGLYLYDASNNLADSIIPVLLPSNVSYGRKPDGAQEWYYFDQPTPATSNISTGVSEVTDDTVFFSTQGGIHIGGLTLVLTSRNTSDSIYYSMNGSEPQVSNDLYTNSISINSPTVIRARIIRKNEIPGPVFTNTYITQIDHEFPVVCLSTDPKNLWDDINGIFVLGPTYDEWDPHYGANYWEEWEVPTNFEFYDEDGVKQIDQLSGMKVFGGWSRMHDQKSVALFARKEYGKGSFEYRFFDKKPINKFESIVLRNGGNDYWGLRFQDEFLTGLTDEMNVDKQAFQPAAIYLNGEYWGIENIREKVNENYIAENHHVDPDQVNLLEATGSILTGSNKKYSDIRSFLSSHSTLTNEDDYNKVASQIDLDNYIQYQLSEIYINNTDWPGNNIKFWNTNSPDSKWRWILFDTDFGFGLYNSDVSFNTLDFALEPNGPGWPNPEWSTRLFRRMVSNIGFRYNFINQYADRINTDFKPAVIVSKLDSLKGLYIGEIQNHINKWGGDYNSWLSLIDQRKIYGVYRPYHARNHIQDVFNLKAQLDINLSVSASGQGKIKLNSIIPKSYPFTGVYFQDVPITMTAVPNPGYKFVKWEGTINSTDLSITFDMHSAGTFKAVFKEAVSEDISVVINEINYNSAATFASKDWIELFNNGSSTVDLSNWLLSDSGADSGFVFPSASILAPGEFLVIYTNLEDFKTVHPNVTNICGNLPFGLSSSGDHIYLFNKNRDLIDYVEYDTYSPWDASANGTGATLELLPQVADNSVASSWKAGISGGTPGSINLWPTTDNPSISLSPIAHNFSCFPNPFSDYTTISFNVVTESFIQLEIYDINGSLVGQLVAERLIPGKYYYDWSGDGLPEGIYNIRLSSNSEVNNFKIVKLK